MEGLGETDALRKVVGLYCATSSPAAPFRRGIWGKPYVSGGPYFNLSNTFGRTMILVAPVAVGFDLEYADRPVRFRELAGKFFFAGECRLIERLNAEEGRALFLRLWVCKEAMVKLSGHGIFGGLRDARVSWGEGGAEGGYYRGRKVWLSQFSPVPGLVAAVASWEKLEVKGFFRF